MYEFIFCSLCVPCVIFLLQINKHKRQPNICTLAFLFWVFIVVLLLNAVLVQCLNVVRRRVESSRPVFGFRVRFNAALTKWDRHVILFGLNQGLNSTIDLVWIPIGRIRFWIEQGLTVIERYVQLVDSSSLANLANIHFGQTVDKSSHQAFVPQYVPDKKLNFGLKFRDWTIGSTSEAYWVNLEWTTRG